MGKWDNHAWVWKSIEFFLNKKEKKETSLKKRKKSQTDIDVRNRLEQVGNH